MQHLALAAGWQLKEYDRTGPLEAAFAGEDWLPASAPGCVHLDLLAAGRIPDPFLGLNEELVQWVGNADWLYRCRFDLPPHLAGGADAIDLCCDGLDTFATVWLNGAQIISSDNMFVPLRVDVRALLRPADNELRVLFRSALREGKVREGEHGARALWNGDSSRLYVRKAQYHYGWDWGPCLLTAGPWRPVRLEAYAVRIADLRCPVTLSDDCLRATVDVQAAIARAPGAPDAPLALRLTLRDPQGAEVAAATAPLRGEGAAHTLTLDAPQLWWPNGYGAQPLYTLAAELLAEGGQQATVGGQPPAVDSRELRIGMRRLRLVQEPVTGEGGTSFVFEVNGRPIFCGGANWIPADSFTPRITRERYRELVELAAAGNMQMLRVWGGGIYEDEAFYDACDELGLLVWQDFMFACGVYPAHEGFQASVRAEAEAAIARLRHHACLALWCGNNEDYQIAESLGLYDAAESPEDAAGRFPARQLYERLLPEVVAQLDPQAIYWPGSPYGGAHSADQTVGDRHTWDIWHGVMAPYQDYPKFEGRFVSEFGMASHPALATIEEFAPPDERYPQSRTLEHHNKASGGIERIAAYMARNLRVPADLPGFVYATQLVQAEALAAAYVGWRRRWGREGAHAVGGALVWQINDCWPVTSWAIVDSALRPKPAYYVVRRALAPIALGMSCGPLHAGIWLVNGTAEALEGELVVEEWTLDGRQVSASSQRARLPANEVLEVGAFAYEHQEHILAARLLAEGRVLARATLWPEPYKYLHLPDPGVSVEREGDDTLRVRCERPAKGVWLDAGDGVAWGDNMLDLVPGDDQVVVARGLGDREVRVRHLQ
jgi:beta-mannosidase